MPGEASSLPSWVPRFIEHIGRPDRIARFLTLRRVDLAAHSRACELLLDACLGNPGSGEVLRVLLAHGFDATQPQSALSPLAAAHGRRDEAAVHALWPHAPVAHRTGVLKHAAGHLGTEGLVDLLTLGGVPRTESAPMEGALEENREEQVVLLLAAGWARPPSSWVSAHLPRLAPEALQTVLAGPTTAPDLARWMEHAASIGREDLVRVLLRAGATLASVRPDVLHARARVTAAATAEGFAVPLPPENHVMPSDEALVATVLGDLPRAARGSPAETLLALDPLTFAQTVLMVAMLAREPVPVLTPLLASASDAQRARTGEMAVKHGSPETLRAVLTAGLAPPPSEGIPPLGHAAASNRRDLIALLGQAGQRTTADALGTAVIGASETTFRALLSWGPPGAAQAPNRDGHTALMSAFANQREDLLDALFDAGVPRADADQPGLCAMRPRLTRWVKDYEPRRAQRESVALTTVLPPPAQATARHRL